MSDYRWGFLGNGWIASILAEDFAQTNLKIQSIGARTKAKADEFANRYNIPNRHASYDALVNDPEVDIVYIATPHTRHHQDALLAIMAGKHVLLEKPFTVNAREASELREAARSRGVFLMEAMWTRFLPVQVSIQEVLQRGLIGKPKYIVAEHSQNLSAIARLWDPLLGGGTLLDLGIYPLNFIVRILGIPKQVTARAHLTDQGVDEALSVIMEFPDGIMATMFSSMSAAGPATAAVMGTEGRIELDYPLLAQTSFRVYNLAGEVIYSYSEPISGTGRQYQALEVERCISAGLGESPIMPLDETLEIIKLTDLIRSQIGVTYQNDF